MSIRKKLILERKKELKMKVIRKIFWENFSLSLSLSLSLSFSKMKFKFFQFEESFYNFKRNIKLINKLNMYDFVDSFRN